jgi:hypothetical protein
MAIVNLHGKSTAEDLLPVFEDFLDNAPKERKYGNYFFFKSDRVLSKRLPPPCTLLSIRFMVAIKYFQKLRCVH